MLMGRKVVRMPRGDRTRLMASAVPLMYNIVAEVVFIRGLCKWTSKEGMSTESTQCTLFHDLNTSPTT